MVIRTLARLVSGLLWDWPSLATNTAELWVMMVMINRFLQGLLVCLGSDHIQLILTTSLG